MDSYEATKTVFSRIRSLDPQNASKIMGYLLLQDHGDKEMIRLAFGPESLLQNLIIQVKAQLGLLCNTPSAPSTPSSPSPFSPISRTNTLSLPSTVNNSNNRFDITNPSSPSTKSWPVLSSHSTASSSSLTYASIVNRMDNDNTGSASLSLTVPLSNAFPNCNGNVAKNKNTGNSNDRTDVYQAHENFSFLNDSAADSWFDSRLDFGTSPTGCGDSHLLAQSFSGPGICFDSEDSNSRFDWKPCLYSANKLSKNDTTTRKFLHGESADGAALDGPPSKLDEFERCQELLWSNAAAAQQQKFAAASQLIAGSSFPYSKCMNFLQQQNDSPRSAAAAAAALMTRNEFRNFGRCRPERNDFSTMGLGGIMNPGSRQIYLTFPADSTFREEDVSSYFSIYGPVQDVRIPYQQKRMFGFVTFVYPDTVKLILAKGNPHFVCDSRVLVKPYKEKGKVPDKKQHQQQLERADYSTCSSPLGIDSIESFDLHLGSRMSYNAQEMLLRRKLEEQADLQQAIELNNGRRLMSLQLKNINLDRQNHHQYLHGLSSGVPSPPFTHSPNNQAFVLRRDFLDQDVPRGNCNDPGATASQNAMPGTDQEQEKNPACNLHNANSPACSKDEKTNIDESNLHESLEHILPDNLFASPKKSANDHLTEFSAEVDDTAPSSDSTNVSSVKSCFLQMPGFSSENGTIGL